MNTKVNRILIRYLTDFNDRTNRLLKELGLPTQFSGVETYGIPDNNNIYLKASFQGLPKRPGSTKSCSENIFITAIVSGFDKGGHLWLTKYATEIGYFRQSNASSPLTDLIPITGYHYDFDCDGTKFNHPVFHAQPKITAGDRYISLTKDITHRDYPDHKELRTIRIPTPQMDIFSSIVMMLADHVIAPDDPKRLFGNYLEQFERSMIKFDLDFISSHITSSFFNANSHHIHNWYPKPTPRNNLTVSKK